MMQDEHNTADAPMVRDIRAYTQSANTVIDERAVAEWHNVSFLTPAEEKWYQSTLDKYRKEFRLRPQVEPSD